MSDEQQNPKVKKTLDEVAKVLKDNLGVDADFAVLDMGGYFAQIDKTLEETADWDELIMPLIAMGMAGVYVTREQRGHVYALLYCMIKRLAGKTAKLN